MAEAESKPNGGLPPESDESNPRLSGAEPSVDSNAYHREEETLHAVLNRFFAAVFFPDPAAASLPLVKRLRRAIADNGPSLKEASKNSTRKLLLWTRRGGPMRAIFVISVGTIILLALIGLTVFLLFFLAATINAIIISLLISLAAAGGFLALFFACLTGIYIVALSVAAFAIFTATVSTIIAVLIATGWIGFFWTLWLAASKGLTITKHSLAMTGSAISAYSTARHVHRRSRPKDTM